MQHDRPQVHPENCCHRCCGILYHAVKRENSTDSTDITGSQRETFHWSEHSPGECCICKHITEMVNLKWVGHNFTLDIIMSDAQPITLVPVPSPRVPSDQASHCMRHRWTNGNCAFVCCVLNSTSIKSFMAFYRQTFPKVSEDRMWVSW